MWVASGRASASGSALSHNGDVSWVEARIVLGRTDNVLGTDENGLLAIIDEVLSGLDGDLDWDEPVITGPFDLKSLQLNSG